MKQLLMQRYGRIAPSVPHFPSLEIIHYEPGRKQDLVRALLSIQQNIPITDTQLDSVLFKKDGVVPESIFLAYLNGKIAGTTTGVHPAGSQTGTVHMVSVLPWAAGKKIGKSLCAHTIRYLTGAGCKKINLTTDDHRLPAIKIYLDLGFFPVLNDTDMPARWKKVLTALRREETWAYDAETAQEPATIIRME